MKKMLLMWPAVGCLLTGSLRGQEANAKPSEAEKTAALTAGIVANSPTVTPARPLSKQAQAVGDAVKKGDPAAALAAAQKGATAGDADSFYALGRLYEEGVGTKADPVKAAENYEKAAKKGCPEGAANFGRCLDLGIGVKADQEKNLFFWKQAADSGLGPAQAKMGIVEAKGVGRPVNLTLAREWFEKAAAQNDPNALYHLSQMHANGVAGLERNPRKAIEMCIKAANGNQLDAVNQVGLYYQEGFGLMQDKVAAAGWFNLAAEYGHADGQANLGQSYEEGIGVKQNFQAAARLYAEAAKQNNSIACFCLARLFEAGRGVPKHLVNAYANYARAAELGFKAAEKQRDELKAKLSKSELADAQKVIDMAKAAGKSRK